MKYTCLFKVLLEKKGEKNLTFHHFRHTPNYLNQNLLAFSSILEPFPWEKFRKNKKVLALCNINGLSGFLSYWYPKNILILFTQHQERKCHYLNSDIWFDKKSCGLWNVIKIEPCVECGVSVDDTVSISTCGSKTEGGGRLVRDCWRLLKGGDHCWLLCRIKAVTLPHLPSLAQWPTTRPIELD